MEAGGSTVQLEPYVYQVGGRSNMLRLDDVTICKPLMDCEHRFYEHLPAPLRPFTPKYKGVLTVHFQEFNDGYIGISADCPSSNPGKSGSRYSGARCRLTGSGIIEITPFLGNPLMALVFQLGPLDPSHAATDLGRLEKELMTSLRPCDDGSRTVGHNPWLRQCHKKKIAAMKRKGKVSLAQKFIMLEDITAQLVRPCILDVKMGTQPYNDRDPEERRQKKMKKKLASCTTSLGFRVHGMQVYQKDRDVFLCYNKYNGLMMSETDLRAVLRQFLHDGYTLQAKLIDPIVDRLRALRDELSKHKFCFHSSSILIVYEGMDATSNDVSPPPWSGGSGSDVIGVVLTPDDRASEGHTAPSPSTGRMSSASDCAIAPPGEKDHDEVSAGFEMCEGPNDRHTGRHQDYSDSDLHGDSSSAQGDAKSQTRQVCDEENGAEEQRNANRKCDNASPHVDVRLVDLEHATFDTVTNETHDVTFSDTSGFLFGLSSLIHILENFRESS